jgi:hypothetical protein
MAMSIRIFGTSTLVGIIAGLIAGFLIFAIERSVILANGNNWITIFRILLGLCVALLGSLITDECLFHDDINQQIEKSKRDSIQSIKERISMIYQPHINASEAAIIQKQSIWLLREKDAIIEAEGKSPTGQVGVGDIANMKLNSADRIRQDYYQAIANRDSLFIAKKAQEEIDITTFENSFGGSLVLKRVEAMFDLVFSNYLMAAVYIIFTLFIWSLEFLVVLIKLNSEETNYERRIKHIEEIGRNRMEKISQRDRLWYDGSIGHATSRSISASINRKSPSIFN